MTSICLTCRPRPHRPAVTAWSYWFNPGRNVKSPGFQKNGSPKYTTRRWAEVANRGDLDAEQVTFEAIPENAAIRLVTPDAPVTIQSGGSRRVPYTLFLQSSGNEKLRVRWVEDGEEKYRDFDLE